MALAFVACGGNGGPPNTHEDGGLDDSGVHIQFDAQKDGVITPQDGGGGDGGGGCTTTCNSTGGAGTGGFCKCNSDCSCGTGANACQNPWPDDTTIAGSCWKTCASTTECTAGTEECVGITSTQGACLTKGTISGTFTDIPSWLSSETPTQTFGSSTVNITVGDINVTFGGGMASQFTGSSGTVYWEIDLMPVTSGTTDFTKVLRIIVQSTDYSAKTWDLSTATTMYVNYENWTISGSSLTAESWQAMVLSGTFTLTAAGAGGGAAVTGSITGGEAFKYILELCGPHSDPC
jgi:hypothetical protein